MPDPSSSESPAKRPWLLTVVGLVLIGGLCVLPFLPWLDGAKEVSDNLRFLGRFHPLILHLPIGVFVLIGLQEFGRMLRFREAGDGIGFPMIFGVLSAVGAVLAGYLLWKTSPDDYAGNDLAERHMWGGIVFASGVILATVLKGWSLCAGWRPIGFRLTLFGSLAIMAFTSHDGASMTHGSDYLTRYAPEPLRALMGLEPVTDDGPSADPLVYADVVEPIFERRCVQCHKEGKSKGRLRMDGFEWVMKGGKEGPAIEPGDADASNIIVRMLLPMEDEGHMPPEGKPQVEPDELMVIKWWINEGASETLKVSESGMPAEIESVVASLLDRPVEVAAEGPSHGIEGPAERDPAVASAVLELTTRYPGTVTFESRQSPGLVFSAVSMREKLGDDQFADFKPVVPHLATVDLSATRVTDRTVELLALAANLRMLRLSETGITDASLESLAALKNLESLNLYGTAVTDQGISKLADMPKLKRLYLWQTAVTDDGVEALRRELPDCVIETGVE